MRLDHDATRRTEETHVTLRSLDAWARGKFKIAVLENSPKGQVQATPASKPWNVVDSRDPEPEQPWYTPARYFARELVKEDSTLLTKRDVLARKVAQSLAGVRILKRGNVKPLDPGTVRKAFPKVSLG